MSILFHTFFDVVHSLCTTGSQGTLSLSLIHATLSLDSSMWRLENILYNVRRTRVNMVPRIPAGDDLPFVELAPICVQY